MSRELPKAPHTREDFRIGIICAKTLEAGMVEMVLDKEWKEEGIFYGSPPNDPTTYTLGLIAGHNVVLAYSHTKGANAAAQAASSLILSFTGIKIIFVVGVCGVVPTYLNQGEMQEVMLGDCMISTAVIQFDLGKRGSAGFCEADGLDTLGRSGRWIGGLISKIQTPKTRSRLTKNLCVHLQALQNDALNEISYPGQQNDRLFEATSEFVAKDLECDGQRLEIRKSSRGDTFPKIHVGYFGSSNGALKSGVVRDELARIKKIIAFEMEASGTWEVLPTVIVKAACDYADSHINKRWQPYAAAVAAAGLKAFLQELQFPDDPKAEVKDNTFNIQFSLEGLPTPKKFIERPSEMRKLEEALLPRSESSQRKVFVLHGLGGIGKTQLAVQFMRTHHPKFSAAFWLDGSSEDSLKRSIANLASKIPPDQISAASRVYARDAKGDINTVVSEVLAWFAKASNNRWLLTFDNVDRDSNSSEPDPLAYDIMRFVPSADHGSVLVTTRLIRLEQLGESMEVKKVDQETARSILESWYKKAAYDEDELVRLLEYLDGLPLAIAQAGAYLQQTAVNIKTYLRFYEDMERDIDDLLCSSHVSISDYPNRSVWTTWNISYASVLAQDEHAAHLLILWSSLDRNDLWYGIFKKAMAVSSVAEACSQWLGDIASQELSFVRAMKLLRCYSLVESSMVTDGYSIHAVVHRWAYSYQGLKNHKNLGILALILVGLAVPMDTEREYASLHQRLLPHAQICTSRALGSSATNVQNSESNNHFTNLAQQQEDVLIAINNLGYLYKSQGKLDEAEQSRMRALKLF